MTQVGPLPQNHPIVGAQTPSRLSISHIHAINPFGTVLQQTVGETSGGDAAIQTNALLHRNREGVQPRQQFLPTPRHKPRWMLDLKLQRVLHIVTGLVQHSPGSIAHLASTDQLLRFLPGGHKTAGHEF